MNREQIERVRTFIEWLNAGVVEGRRTATELLALPPAQWNAWMQENNGALSFHLFDNLLEESHALLTRDPAAAVELTGFVVRYVGSATTPAAYRFQQITLEGRAWTERANALRQVVDLPGALRACQTATAILSANPVADAEMATARLVEAFVRHQMGEQGKPLQMIREVMTVFKATNTGQQLLRARFYEGGIEFDCQRYQAAADIFNDALQLAQALGDDEAVAGLHLNLGHCAQELGRSEAIHHLVTALKLFEQHGMVGESPRAVWGLARLLADAGQLEFAERELKRAASELATAGMPREAALVWLDLLDMLVLMEKHEEVAERAAELVRTFGAAGMSAEATHALSLLQSISGYNSDVTKKIIEDTRIAVQSSP